MTRAVRQAVKGQTFDAPQGPVRIDPATQHMIQIARVGRVDGTGRFVEVYSSPPADRTGTVSVLAQA